MRPREPEGARVPPADPAADTEHNGFVVRLAMLRWIDTIVPRRVLFQRDRTLLHLFLGRVVASTGFAISIPFLGLYLHGTRGVPMTAVGGVFFLGAVAGALGQIVGGEWCDRSGRKPVLIVSQILRSIAFLALGLAVYWNGPFWMFALFTSLSGFAGRMCFLPRLVNAGGGPDVSRSPAMSGDSYGVSRMTSSQL